MTWHCYDSSERSASLFARIYIRPLYPTTTTLGVSFPLSSAPPFLVRGEVGGSARPVPDRGGAWVPMAFDGRVPAEAACSSSSLGNDSDEGTTPAEKDGDGEVQSAYNGAGLGALEEALPIRRGISQFYNGKSRSFTLLKDAIGPSGSAKVIAKADNAYTRKRKILLAHSIIYDKSHITSPETYEAGIPKRIASLSRLRPLDSISPNSSSSSLSSDENEVPQQFIFVQSPDHTSHFASPTMITPRLCFCASKPLPVPMRSFSMVNLHRLHMRCSSVCLKEEPKAD